MTVERGPAEGAAGGQPGRADDAGRLADHVGDEDADRHRRLGRLLEQVDVELDAGVGQGEQGHDDEARPRMQAVLDALVRGDRGGQAPLGGVGELGRRLLAEGPGLLGGALEVVAGRRVGAGHQADGQADDDRVDARLEHGDPQADADDDCSGRSASGR